MILMITIINLDRGGRKKIVLFWLSVKFAVSHEWESFKPNMGA